MKPVMVAVLGALLLLNLISFFLMRYDRGPFFFVVSG